MDLNEFPTQMDNGKRPVLNDFEQKVDMKKKQINWTRAMDTVLIDTFLDAYQQGKKQGRVWDESVYVSIKSAVLAKCHEHIEKNHIVSRVRTMRTEFNSFMDLKSRSGFGWDPIKATIDAPDEKWDELLSDLKSREKFKGFRDRGPKWPLEHLAIIVGNTYATGGNAFGGLDAVDMNKLGNLLFLEAPVGVGYSYTNKTEDLLKLGDKITAEDSHTFLLQWFKKFHNFKSHEFYIAGESYAGHYVPQLAELISDRNKGASKGTVINFKGFMIGNAVINDATDQTGFVEYAWSHAIISDRVYHSVLKECDFKQDNQTTMCTLSFRAFLQAYSDIDIYSIYTPVCLASGGSKKPRSKLITAPRFLTQHDLWHDLPSGYDPCTEDYTETYFNRADVQKALHANVTKLNYPYTPCSNVIRKWGDSAETTLPIIQKLLNAGIRIWVYSGDTDGRVPVTSTRYSLNELKYKVKDEWRAWFHRHQVAGWVTTFESGLTYATVRGAGHQVPVFAPAQSLTLFSHFISGTNLPPSGS